MDLTMEDISLKVVRHEERLFNHGETIGELKNVVEGLVEASRNQSHAVDQLLERAKDENLSERMKVLETAFDRAKFVWKVVFTVATTPPLVYFGVQLFNIMSKANGQ